ncbi:MAG: hypothetical protein K6F08_03990 [bacterium]|nr:hypothetical protein [bacterium]
MDESRFKNSLTNMPIVGKPKLGLRKRIYDSQNQIVGTTSGNKIFDLNGRLWGTVVTKDTASGYNKNDIISRGDVIGTIDESKNIYAKRRSATSFDVLPSVYIGRVKANKIVSVLFPLLIALISATAVTGTIVAGIIKPDDDYLNTAPVLKVANQSNQQEWTQNGNLKIFYSNQYNTDAYIAPGDSGEYRFVINNANAHPIEYSITLTEHNENEFSLRYRLMGETYVIGGEGYKDIGTITIPTKRLEAGQSQVYRLFWFWDPNVDDELDTLNGQYQSEYKINISVNASFV